MSFLDDVWATTITEGSWFDPIDLTKEDELQGEGTKDDPIDLTDD